MAKTEFDVFIREEVEKLKGVMVPVKASIFERFTRTDVPCSVLHPNPEDEFCFPDIGPNYKIISDYMEQIRTNLEQQLPVFIEPLIVEKVRPNGYMLLNGHHRWAAAIRSGVKKVPIRIVNLAQESDIINMLANSTHEKRVTLDLDEVIFRDNSDPNVEPVPGLMAKRLTKKRIRLGIPALFRFLSKSGYDIWLYSADYYSIDDIRKLFRKYSVHVDGIITGTGKRKTGSSQAAKKMEKLVANKYTETMHIDNETIIITRGKKEDFIELVIEALDDKWSKTAIELLETLQKNENQE